MSQAGCKSKEDDPEDIRLYFKYIDDVKELVKCDSPSERMQQWKEICDRFQNLSVSSEKKQKFLSISVLVLKSKFSVTSLQMLDTVSSDLKTLVKPFSLTKFAEKLKLKFRNENGVIDYSPLAPCASRAFQPAPHFLYLRGTDFFADMPIPEKRQRVRHAKDPTEEKTKPSALSNKKSDVPDNEIAVVYNALKKAYNKNNNNPIIFWRLITDPDSFSNTVDNIFYVSFLIRESLARIFFDNDNMFMIEPTVSNRKDRDKNKKIDQKQTIVPMDHAKWKDLIAYFSIKKPLIKW